MALDGSSLFIVFSLSLSLTAATHIQRVWFFMRGGDGARVSLSCRGLGFRVRERVCMRARVRAASCATISLGLCLVVNGCVHIACAYIFNDGLGAERDWACQGGVRARALRHMRMRHGANYKPTLTARNRVTRANRTPL